MRMHKIELLSDLTPRAGRDKFYTLTALCSIHKCFFEKYACYNNPSQNGFLSRVSSRIEKAGISIGKQYGLHGIHYKKLILGNKYKNTVIEITPTVLCSLSPKVAKFIIENYTVIFSDIPESGLRFMHLDIIKKIAVGDIKPRQVYILGSDYTDYSFDNVNVKYVNVNIWPLIVVCQDSILSQCTWDLQVRQQVIKQIEQTSKHFAISLNKKPRPHRVELLAQLDNKNLLHHVAWSLYFKEYPGGSQSVIGQWKNNLLNIINDQTNCHIHNFLKKYPLPRKIDCVEKICKGLNAPLSSEYIGKFNWNIVTETYNDFIDTPFGLYSHITEKSYKSFYMGAMPMIVGTAGIEQHLRNQGFWLPNNNYDHLNGRERVNAVVDAVEYRLHNTQSYNTQCIKNFKHAIDFDWICSQVVDPLLLIVP